VEPPADIKADFFISFAKGDEAYLTEVTRVLDSLGKSYTFPDRDNSKKAARNALRQADRVIPLYTRNYVQSDDCVSEWVHAYNLDTATAEQRMIALRFDQADLKPLMNGVSVHDISRLLPEQRKQAIAKWIEWKPLPLTRTNVEKTLTTHLDPGVEASGTGIEAKLDTARDTVLNETHLPAQLAAAMEALRLVLDLARLSERNLSSMMQNVLKLYDNHFTENGRDSSWGGLDRYMTVIGEGTADLSAATMREEKAAFEQLIAAHGNCMDALASADEQKRELAHVPVQNADAAAIDSVIDRLKEVAEQAHDQDASTDNYDKEAKNLVSQGRDFAFEVGAPDAAKKPATARMRFLRYVGGFGIRTLSVLGSMASIRQTPEFEKLLQAAEDLVEEFYKLLGL
jgi:TIR domain